MGGWDGWSAAGWLIQTASGGRSASVDFPLDRLGYALKTRIESDLSSPDPQLGQAAVEVFKD